MNLAQKRLAALRRTRGLTLAQLADAIGVTEGFISHVIRGRRRPGPKVLRWLGLTAREVYQQKDRNESAPGSVA